MTFRPCPKPQPREKKKPERPTPKKRPRRVNIQRSTAAFAHNYGSLERVLWVKAQPCVCCEALGVEQVGRSENAHTEIAGAGLKEHYSTIIPLCPTHHVAYDQRLAPLDDETLRERLKALAASVHKMYESFGGF